MARLLVTVDEDKVTLRLMAGPKLIDETTLTLSQGFDTLLITALDKLLRRNKLKKLSLNKAYILGKVKQEAVSWRVIAVFAEALSL